MRNNFFQNGTVARSAIKFRILSPKKKEKIQSTILSLDVVILTMLEMREIISTVGRKLLFSQNLCHGFLWVNDSDVWSDSVRIICTGPLDGFL